MVSNTSNTIVRNRWWVIRWWVIKDSSKTVLGNWNSVSKYDLDRHHGVCPDGIAMELYIKSKVYYTVVPTSQWERLEFYKKLMAGSNGLQVGFKRVSPECSRLFSRDDVCGSFPIAPWVGKAARSWNRVWKIILKFVMHVDDTRNEGWLNGESVLQRPGPRGLNRIANRCPRI